MQSGFLCRKHQGEEPIPPGGYIYEDEHWMICHAQPHMGLLGTLFLEWKRHLLDYAEMTDEQSDSLGNVLRKIYGALKAHTQAERIYQVTPMGGVPHFHSWLVPHRKNDPEKGMKFLARDDSCNEEDAIALANKLREALK